MEGFLAPGSGGSDQDAARGSGRFGVAIVLDVGRGGDGTSRDVTDTPGEDDCFTVVGTGRIGRTRPQQEQTHVEVPL